MEQILSSEDINSAIIDSKDPILLLDQLLSEKHEINYEELLYCASYHCNTDIMEWIFSHKNLISNINLEEVFDNIGKYGVETSEKQFIILLENGYTNYKKLLNKTYKKYPDFVNTFIDKIPNKKVKTIKNFPKNKEEMAAYIYNMHYSNTNILDCYPLSTLRHIVFAYTNEEYNEENEKESYYDSREEYEDRLKEIRKYKKSKGEPRYKSTEYLKYLINDIISSELDHGDYKPVEYPVWHLAHGLIMENNWDYLNKKGKVILANIYNVRPTYRHVFAAQSKIIKELANDEELSADMDTRGVSMLNGLY